MTLRFRSCGLSDVGRIRPHNEDCFEIEAAQGLYLVADGMGGHGHGEVASAIAVDAVRNAILSGGGDKTSGGNSGAHAERLRTAVGGANEQVLAAAREDGSLSGMGTTLVAMHLAEGVAAVAHVGDSRAYRVRDGELELLTEDHTWVREQVVAGNLSAEQARTHPLKSVVTRALGGDPKVNVDLRKIPVVAGDRFLLCSDGLTAMVPDERIRGYMTADAPLEKICRELVDDANNSGGLDNITVIVIAAESE